MATATQLRPGIRETAPVKNFSILVATTGNAIWHSADSGKSFAWPRGVNNVDCVARGFGVDPFDPRHVLACMALAAPPYSPLIGAHHGLYESFDGGAKWSPVAGFPQIECWRATFDPTRRGRYFVGTRPAAIYRTDDGGKSFRQLAVDLPQTCEGIGLPRVTTLLLHPKDPKLVFASIEIGGFRRSADGGESWEAIMHKLDLPVPENYLYGAGGRIDAHFIRLSGADLLLAGTPDGMYASRDLGDTWNEFPVKRTFPHQFFHDAVVKADDPDTIFVGVGESVNGQEGAIHRTRDRGATWDTVELPVECNSPIWCFAQHASDPEVLLACTHKGQLFGSEDGGQTWIKYRREFTDVRGIAWLPN